MTTPDLTIHEILNVINLIQLISLYMISSGINKLTKRLEAKEKPTKNI